MNRIGVSEPALMGHVGSSNHTGWPPNFVTALRIGLETRRYERMVILGVTAATPAPDYSPPIP
jgi:hypothetical protein